MIRVLVLYPRQQGSTFDMKYYTEKHIPLAKDLLAPHGLLKLEADKGISAADPGAPSPFVLVAHLTFNSLEDVHKGFMAVGKEVMGDISNFTNIQPQIQISDVIG